MFTRIGEMKVRKSVILLVVVVAAIAVCAIGLKAFASPTNDEASGEILEVTLVEPKKAVLPVVNDVMLSDAELEALAAAEKEAEGKTKVGVAETTKEKTEATKTSSALDSVVMKPIVDSFEDDSATVFTEDDIVYWDPSYEDVVEGGAELEAQAVSDEVAEASSEAEVSGEAEAESDGAWDGPTLNSFDGVCEGPSGHETYYNMPMGGVLDIMYSEGFEGEYWVDDNGCKMFGDYIMVAANLAERPRGTLVETSLGTGIVCDTGGFAYADPTAIDVAVTW